MKRIKLMLMALLLMPIMVLATTYYVNGTTGNDSNTGLSTTTAKKTIQAAVDVATDGSTILVAAGTYEPIVCVGKTLNIESLAGKQSTIIDGNYKSRCVRFTNKYGSFGPPVEESGVYNSRLIGFTLRNGTVSTICTTDDNAGGGVWGGTIEDCVIENCSAYSGGGVLCSKLIRCIVRNNTSDDDGGGCHECIIYDSLIVGNRANNSYGGAAGSAASCSKLYNCTITKNVAVENNCNSVGALDYYISAYNCIVYGNVTDSGKTANITSAWGEYYGANINNYIENPHFIDAVNGDYRLASDSPCIDAGDNSYVMNDTDFDGNARIINGKVDVGCYEYRSSSLTDGLVAWYKFDGNANDSSGNGNDGVVHGAILTTDRFGNENGAYQFGDGKYITVANSESLNTPVDEITIATWVNIDDFVYPSQYGTVTILTKGNWEELQYGMHYLRNYDKQIFIGKTPTGSLMACTNLTLSVHEWFHIAYTFRHGIAWTYLNGVLVSAYTNTISAFYSGNADLRIARNTCGLQECMHGTLDDLRIYNRALSAVEVSEIYNENGNPIVYHTVAFNANGGMAEMGSCQVENGTMVGTLPTATRDGYKFRGWFTAADGGTKVTSATIVTADVTWYAHWQKQAEDQGEEPDVPAIDLGDDDEPMDANIANTYDGVIMDADGLPVGYINVKAAKASGKGDSAISKVTATIQMAGESKKVTIKANASISEATLTQAAADGRILDLSFSRNGIWGTFDDYAIEGTRVLLASTAKSDKGSDAQIAAEAAFNTLKGNYVLAFEDENGWNGLSISIMAKGKVKVSGKLADGTSVSTTSQLIVGLENSCIPVIYTKKDTSIAFSIYFSNDGSERSVFGYCNAVISPITGLNSGLSFYLDDSVYDLFDDYSLCDQFLPYGVSIEPVSATKWVVANGAKAGSIKVVNGEAVDTKESENPSGLKLSFKSKTGTFSGSFKVYTLDAKNKLKNFSASVSGVVVDGVGYGTATIKGVGSFSVMIDE